MGENRICVVGGGASGLMAGIFAAQRGGKVTILEHGEKPGKKLLATGNGRCNMTNLFQEPFCYHSQDLGLAWEILNRFFVQDAIGFFSSIGVYTKNKDGYIYPASMQASCVQELLELKARSLRIKIKCRENVVKIRAPRETGSGFLVETGTWSYPADRVILACGSPASRIEGASKSGYALAESLGHSLRKPLPALVPLRGRGDYFQKWAGVRAEGQVSLEAKGSPLDFARGELQLTDYGVSGIPVFQVSGAAVRLLEEGVPVRLSLDFMPDFTLEGLEAFLQRRLEQCPYKTKRELLVGLLPKKLGQLLLEDDPALPLLAQRIKSFSMPVTGAHSLDMAQVCSGGVPLGEIDPKTMESKRVSGLYFAGELLDVDGICGGYNLQWAWSTGALAGMAAAEEREKERGKSGC